MPTYSRARGQGRIGPRGRADVGGAIVLRVKRLSDGAEETLHGSRRDDLGRRESARALPKCNGNLAKKRIQKNLTRLRRGRGQLYLVGVLTLSRSQWGMAGHEIHAWGSPRRVLSRGSEVSEVGGAKRRACSGHLHNLAANGRVSHPLAALFSGADTSASPETSSQSALKGNEASTSPETSPQSGRERASVACPGGAPIGVVKRAPRLRHARYLMCKGSA